MLPAAARVFEGDERDRRAGKAGGEYRGQRGRGTGRVVLALPKCVKSCCIGCQCVQVGAMIVSIQEKNVSYSADHVRLLLQILVAFVSYYYAIWDTSSKISKLTMICAATLHRSVM